MEQTGNQSVTAGVTIEGDASGAEANTRVVAEAPRRGVDDLKRGSTVGRYVVLGKLGAGGMGVVFSGYDPELDRKVAIKVLRPARGEGTDASVARARFLREAQTMARLSHPNVAAVYDVGTLDESVFIAMEFIDGITLHEWVEREVRRESDVHDDWRRAVEMFRHAGRGLVAAHQAGIIHRDFKPDNVMVDAEGKAVVLDFGLARPSGDYDSQDGSMSSSGSGAGAGALTTAGAVMGTPRYMAPEQHRGLPVDARTDQFAFCVALFEALYDQRPFAGDNVRALAAAVCSGRLQPPPKSRVPGRIERAVLRGLSTEPDERHPSMAALLAELAPRRSRSTLAGAGTLVIAGGAFATAMVVGREPAPCAAAAGPIEDAWGEPQRKTLREAFVAFEKADGEATFGRVAAVLDGWARRWAEQRRDACEAVRVRAEQSEEVLELRYACLDRQLRRLSALLDVLFETDETVVFQAVELSHGLPPTSDCTDVERLRRQVPPPDDAASREEVDAIRERLAAVTARADAGKTERAREECSELRKERIFGADDEEVTYPLDLLGEAYIASRRLDDATETLERSIEILTATRGAEDPRVGRPTAGLGEVALQRGDEERARELFTRVLALIDPTDARRAVARARAKFGLARILARSGQRSQALSLAREAETALAEEGTDPARREAIAAWLRAQG